jgi:hypothetical protein
MSVRRVVRCSSVAASRDRVETETLATSESERRVSRTPSRKSRPVGVALVGEPRQAGGKRDVARAWWYDLYASAFGIQCSIEQIVQSTEYRI